jgi:hypothetical protein
MIVRSTSAASAVCSLPTSHTRGVFHCAPVWYSSRDRLRQTLASRPPMFSVNRRESVCEFAKTIASNSLGFTVLTSSLTTECGCSPVPQDKLALLPIPELRPTRQSGGTQNVKPSAATAFHPARSREATYALHGASATGAGVRVAPPCPQPPAAARVAKAATRAAMRVMWSLRSRGMFDAHRDCGAGSENAAWTRLAQLASIVD